MTVAASPGRRLTFDDTQLLLDAVSPGRGNTTDADVLAYIGGLDITDLAKDIENSRRNEDQSIKIIALAREQYGKISAYKTLQGAVI